MDIAERERLMASIAGRIADYREGEIERIEADDVREWLRQFERQDRAEVLRGTDRILAATYVSRRYMKEIVAKCSANRFLTGNDARAFWATAGFLRIQRKGCSQGTVLDILQEVLQERFGLTTEAEESATNTYIYVDDAVFSGNTVRHDIKRWLEESDIRNANIHVLTSVLYLGGEYNVQKFIGPILAERRSTLRFWAPYRLENRKAYAMDAAVMWPTGLPGDEYVDRWCCSVGGREFVFRPPGGVCSKTLFASEESRETVEHAFFKKGAYICSLPAKPKAQMRPLGYSGLKTPGFGATLITYRNCPNNAPLVLWWGDPKMDGPVGMWKPLLPRRVNANNRGVGDYGF